MDNGARESAVMESARTRERWLVSTLSLRSVVVTRSGAQGDALVRRFTELGANVLHYPALAFAPPQSPALLREAVENIAHYHWGLFTSANAVQAVADQIVELHGHLDVALPSIATVGQATAAAVNALGWVVDFTAARGGGLALATDLPVSPGSRILLPRADIASADLPNVLRDRDCVVREVVAYRTLSNTSTSLLHEVPSQPVDALTFTSPSTVASFVAAAKTAGWNLVRDQQRGPLIVACIGETTAAEVRRHNLVADAVATEQTAEGLIDALARALPGRYNRASALPHDLESF